MNRLIVSACITGLLGGMCGGLLVSMDRPVWARERMVVAESFAIRDGEGKLRAALSLGDRGSVGLVFLRPDGQTLSSQLMVNPEGESTLTFFDERGKARRMINRKVDF